MKIAVASQNREVITPHVGRCLRFWIYQIDDGNNVVKKELLELPHEQSLHESSPHDPHPLDDVDALIGTGMGFGLMRRLDSKEVEAVVTSETNPDKAVADYIEGSLDRREVESRQGCRHKGSHPHQHRHRHGMRGHRCHEMV